MKRWVALLLLATPVVAQDVFGPPSARLYKAYPGARERYAESLALLKEHLAKDYADVVALERFAELADDTGRTTQFLASLRVIVASKGPEAKRRARLRGLLGHVLVMTQNLGGGWMEVNLGGRKVRIRMGPGNVPDARKTYLEAVAALRACIKEFPEDARAKEDLAKALEGLDPTKKDEIDELRKQAAVLRMRDGVPPPPRIDLSQTAQQLREGAEELEQRKSAPDHTAALALRKKALVYAYCTETIRFTYEPSAWQAVSLLAAERVVQEYMTRTYIRTQGDIDAVPAHYNPPKPAQRLALLRTLAADKTAQSAAVLLGIVMQDRYADNFADEAVVALGMSGNPALAEHLPALLETELFHEERETYRHFASRRLVALAGALKLEAAAPLLVRALPRDRKLDRPLYVARALADIGRAEDAEVLFAYARNGDHDVWGRREAVAALARLQPDRLAALEDDPLLEIAIAGARYRTQPTDALRGRILAGFSRMHEVDEAAALCIELEISEAVPLLEDLIDAEKHPYAIEGAKAALTKLQARVRGS